MESLGTSSDPNVCVDYLVKIGFKGQIFHIYNISNPCIAYKS